MSEPKLEWGPESEALFQDARRALSPPSAARARVRARVALKVGTAAAAAAVGTATTKAAAGTAGVSAATKGVTAALVLKIVAPVILVGAVAAAAGGPELVRARETSSRGATSAIASPNAGTNAGANGGTATATPTRNTASTNTDESSTNTLQTAPSPLPSSTGTPSAKAPRRDAPSEPTDRKHGAPSSASVEIATRDRAHVEAPPADAVRRESAATLPDPLPAKTEAATAAPSAEETALVGEIDRALRAGDAARALRIAAEHEKVFPRGMLVEEREGARVIARCMTGGASEASTFLAAHPRSPMRARILAACSASHEGR